MPCLEIIDLRNAEQMSGVLDLTRCKRIKEVYTEGTSVSEVKLPKGSKIEKLHLSDDVTTLSYQVIKYLNDLVLPSDASGITLVYLEECDALDGMSTLEEIYNTNGQSLEFIRLLWRSERTITGPQVRMLVNIMQNLEKDGTTSHAYHGVDPTSGSGQTSYNPTLEGKLLASSYYKSDIELLAGGGEEEDSEDHAGMKVIQSPYFGALYITYAPENEYIVFSDTDAITALYSAGIGDGVGVTMEEASNTSSIGSAFTGNTNISSFDELEYFTSITSLSSDSFRGCTALTSITLPESITSIGNSAFRDCSALQYLNVPHESMTVAQYAFYGCTSLTDLYCPGTPQEYSLYNTGNGTGTLYVRGNALMTNGFTKCSFRHIIISGGATVPVGGRWFTNTDSYTETLRVYGNCDIVSDSRILRTNIYGSATRPLKFGELLGFAGNSAGQFCTEACLSPDFIMHLGYTSRVACLPYFVNADSIYVTKIYVGDGSSLESDQAVLDLYLADSGWSEYSDKLDLWYNYDGEYKNDSEESE